MLQKNVFIKQVLLIISISVITFAQDFEFFEPKATLAGYGELHYNYVKPESDIVRTTDSGDNWEQDQRDTMTFAFFPVLNIQFYNSHYGYAYGGRFDIAGVIWRTTNGGGSWTPIDTIFAPPDEI